MNVIVTGGSGFIGTNLIENLLQNNFIVLNLDKVPPVKADQMPQWKQVDILDQTALEKAVLDFKPEIIVHLAAVTDLDGLHIDYYQTNTLGTHNLINVASNTPSLKKVIFTSSMYVCKPGYMPSDYQTFHPHTLYGESKAMGELMVLSIKSCNYSWVIVRPTSIWGPWFKTPYIDFFNIVYQRKYFNFGRACTKTYGYVGNTVFQLRKLMAADNVHGKTFYLGDKQPIPISEWANEISIKLGKGIIKSLPFVVIKAAAIAGDLLALLHVKFPMTSFRLKNMTTDNVFPLEDIYQETGNTPFTREQGVDETIKWLVESKGYQINNQPAKTKFEPVLNTL